MSRKILLLGAAGGAGLLFAIIIAIISIPTAAQTGMNTTGNGTDMSEQSPSFLFKLYRKYHDYDNGIFTVRAGGGGPVGPLTWFFPRTAEINAGETVTWINPASVGEPHT